MCSDNGVITIILLVLLLVTVIDTGIRFQKLIEKFEDKKTDAERKGGVEL